MSVCNDLQDSLSVDLFWATCIWVWMENENIWLMCQMSHKWIKAECVRIVFLEYHYILPPPVYSLESSLTQATLIPCQHWCHKWPHFSAYYWSIQYDTALLFVIQLTKSRHCHKWSDLSLPLCLSNTFHNFCFYFSVVCFRCAALPLQKRKHPVSHLLIGSDKPSQWCM